MKSLIKLPLSLFVLAFCVSIASFGKPQDGKPEKKSFAVAMYPAIDASKLWLLLEKYKLDDRINIELVNERGQVMFRETLPAKGSKRNAYRQQFDLNQVVDGKYTFRVSSAAQTEEITFKLSTPAITQQLSNRLISMN